MVVEVLWGRSSTTMVRVSIAVAYFSLVGAAVIVTVEDGTVRVNAGSDTVSTSVTVKGSESSIVVLKVVGTGGKRGGGSSEGVG